MGQRFTIDAAIFQQLIYENVQENSQGGKRMLPDVLDVAAALGSDAAYSILEEQGDTDYENYPEQMEVLREGFENAPETIWSASLPFRLAAYADAASGRKGRRLSGVHAE